jgi:hypothetical protein
MLVRRAQAVDAVQFGRIHLRVPPDRGAGLFRHRALEPSGGSGVALGNSRAEIGFDPESPAWPESARPVFNLALPGAGIGAIADELAKALRSASPRLVAVGPDFLDFRVDPSSERRVPATRGPNSNGTGKPGISRNRWAICF